MHPRQVKNAADARRLIEERGIDLSVIECGLGFCDVVLGWDSGRPGGQVGVSAAAAACTPCTHRP